MKSTVKQFVAKRQYLTEAAFRWMLFNRATTGLDRAVIKIGRKILIDEEKYEEWENKHREIA